MKEDLKLKTIKPCQPLLGTKPDKTSPILYTGHDSIIGQTIIIPVMSEIIGSPVRHYG
jgi:hypothetical protein